MTWYHMHPEPSGVISGVGRMRVNYALFISALKNTLIAYMIKEVLNQPIFFFYFFCFTCQFMLTYSCPDSKYGILIMNLNIFSCLINKA